MATIRNWIFLLLLICAGGRAAGQLVLEEQPVFSETTELRQKLVKVEESQLGVREATGNNDGKEIRKFLLPLGLREGNPYCAAGQCWSHNQADIPCPQSGYCPDWFKANIVYRKNEPRMKSFVSRPGQVFGIWHENKGRVAHMGMIKDETRLYYITIEFNTSEAGSRDGQGVFSLIRQKNTIYEVADYVGWREYKEGVKTVIKTKNVTNK